MPSKFPWSRSNRSNQPAHPYTADNPERSYSRQSHDRPQDRPPYSPDPYQTSFGDVNYAQQPCGHDQELPHEYSHQPKRPDIVLPDDAQEYHQGQEHPAHIHDSKRHHIRNIFGLGSSRENVADAEQQSGSSKLSLGRKVSVSVKKNKHSPAGSQHDIHSPVTHGPPQQGPGHPPQPPVGQSDYQDYRNQPIPPPYRQDHNTQLYSRENASYTSSRSEQDDAPRPPPHQDPQAHQRYAPYRHPDVTDDGRPTSVWSSAEQGADYQEAYEHSGQGQDYDSVEPPLRNESLARKQPPPPSNNHQRQHSELNKISTTGPPAVSRDPSFLQPDQRRQGEPLSAASGTSPSMSAAAKGSQQVSDMGRQTPPPRTANDLSEQEINQLLKEYKELREKYSKVKRYYFDKEDQVKTLQNTLAHQRLSASRTSLDDGEYIARLSRLDGLISQLAFGFRKEWKKIPVWLQQHVNKDAITIGKQEMTAVGRAFISRWLADELFDKYFHPGIDPELSEELKTIQRNIRLYCPPFQNAEEEEALNAKLNSWRLLTMDGLQPQLSLQDSTSRREALVQKLNKELVDAIQSNLADPPPPGIEGGVNMIVELAVGMLQHLPAESRDVHIEYFSPGTTYSADLMKAETGIPVLSTPAGPGPNNDTSSDSAPESAANEPAEEPEATTKGEETKKGFLGGLMGGGSTKSRPEQAPPKKTSAANSQTSLVQQASAAGAKVERVRLCVSLGLQIRGRSVLSKAPVYTTA